MHRATGITRQQILSAIKLNGSMTADSLGRKLGISPVAVRQHLSALEAEGIVYTSVERKGLGRPVHRYALTEEGDETFPRMYNILANSLLEEIRANQGEEAVDALFSRQRDRLRAINHARLAGKSLEGKVSELARIQTEAGYMATVEPEGDGLRLVEHNCAICQVARMHPSLCHHEIELFRDLLGDDATVERETHILAGDHTCSYLVRNRN